MVVPEVHGPVDLLWVGRPPVVFPQVHGPIDPLWVGKPLGFNLICYYALQTEAALLRGPLHSLLETLPIARVSKYK